MNNICSECFKAWEKEKDITSIYIPSLDFGEQCNHCGKCRGLLEFLN